MTGGGFCGEGKANPRETQDPPSKNEDGAPGTEGEERKTQEPTCKTGPWGTRTTDGDGQRGRAVVRLRRWERRER